MLGSENQLLLSARFSFHFGIALASTGFISKFLCLSLSFCCILCLLMGVNDVPIKVDTTT